MCGQLTVLHSLSTVFTGNDAHTSIVAAYANGIVHSVNFYGLYYRYQHWSVSNCVLVFMYCICMFYLVEIIIIVVEVVVIPAVFRRQ